MSLQDKDGAAPPPPGIYKRKPSPGGTGGKEDDDGMEHLDEEVTVTIVMVHIYLAIRRELFSPKNNLQKSISILMDR